jgi:hypothetical protein
LYRDYVHLDIQDPAKALNVRLFLPTIREQIYQLGWAAGLYGAIWQAFAVLLPSSIGFIRRSSKRSHADTVG